MNCTANLPTELTPYGPILVCPKCGNQHTRPSQAVRGNSADESLGYVGIRFQCEQGHYFSFLAIADHGLTYVQTTEGGEL